MTQNQASVLIIGAGPIGIAFAMLLIDRNHRIFLIDNSPKVLRDVHKHSYLAQALTSTSLTLVHSLTDITESIDFVIECASENLKTKQAILKSLESVETINNSTAIASTSSAFTASEIFSNSKFGKQGLIAHPLNPPSTIPLIELVPSPLTEPTLTQRAKEFFSSAGMHPVTLKKEIPGFISNRLQAALLREAYALVNDNIAEPEDIDLVVSKGLGRRWVFNGPFETADLNTAGGLEQHAVRLGNRYGDFGAARDNFNPWTQPELLFKVVNQLRKNTPIDELPRKRVQRNDHTLKLRNFLGEL